MKKLILLSALFILFAVSAKAIDFSTASMTANFQAQICEPIAILDPGTIQLGDIPPGVTKALNAESYRMQFTVTGCQNWLIQVGGSCNATGDQGDCLLSFWWQYWAGGWNNYVADADLSGLNLTLDGSGKAYVSVYPMSISTQPTATAGTRSFQVILSASYQNM